MQILFYKKYKVNLFKFTIKITLFDSQNSNNRHIIEIEGEEVK